MAGIALLAAAAPAGALPQRTLVARPLPPGVLAAAEAPDSTAAPRLTVDSARRFSDSLLVSVSALRELKALRPVPVQAATPGSDPRPPGGDHPSGRHRGQPAPGGDAAALPRARAPRTLDLVQLYYDLLDEQLAGFYDIDRREMVLADWLSPEQLAPVVTHELAHALQDQHFSLRVRKRLGFESPDAEAAWHALIEGDATAVMAERRAGAATASTSRRSATATRSVALAAPAARAVASGFGLGALPRRTAGGARGSRLPVRPRPALRGVPVQRRRLAGGGCRVHPSPGVHRADPPPRARRQL